MLLALIGIFIFLTLLPWMLRWWPVRFAAYALAASAFVLAMPMLPALWRSIWSNPVGEGMFVLLLIALTGVIASGAVFETYSRLRHGRWLLEED